MPYNKPMRPPVSWDYDCAILGGGPGGLVSGIYLGRFKRKTILINNGKPRAAWIPKTHNLIGFPSGISGKEILQKLSRHLNRFRVDRLLGLAEVRRHQSGFEIRLGKEKILARKVIAAVGIEDIQPNLSNLKDLRETGLLRYCPICDAYEYCDKQICVLAQDEKGIRSALFMSHYTGKLRLILPANIKIPSKLMREMMRTHITIVQGNLEAMEKCSSPRGLKIFLKGHKSIFCHAAYVELGSWVRDEGIVYLKKLNRSSNGRLITDLEQHTSIPGLFAVGDCVHQIGQISIAAAHGAIAATTIHNELRGKI